MRAMRQVVFSVFLVAGVAFAGSANAQAGIDVGIGFTFAPGQQGTSPGQAFNAAKPADPATALPPGKLYLQNRATATDPTTVLPPGHSPTHTNYGRSKKTP